MINISLSLKTAFKGAIIGVSALASVVTAAPLPRPGETCVTAAEIRNPDTPLARYIQTLYRAAAENTDGPLHKVCVNPDLWAQAQAFPNEGTIRIRAGKNYDIAPDTVLTLHHELRHMDSRQHRLLNLANSLGTITIPPWQRAAMAIFIEADAFASEVAFAYEKEQKGHPEYAREIRLCPACPTARMLSRYEQSITREKPGDLSSAMQEAFLTFFRWKNPDESTPSTRTLYLERIAVAPYSRANWNPNPSAPACDLLSDENLHLLGQRDNYNYMKDDKFKSVLRTEIFSEGYYADLVRWFNSGASGPAP